MCPPLLFLVWALNGAAPLTGDDDLVTLFVDGQSEAAMQKLQADNGWQTKLIPDSRAIIKLGLGPNHDTGIGAGGSSSLTASEPSHAVFSQQ